MGVPRLPYLPPLWRESRAGFEAAQLLRSPVWRGEGVPPGDGRAVLLVPGFLVGDGSLATMTKWLRTNGYRTRRAGIRVNVGCSEEACVRLEERLEALADRAGTPVAIVGQSRGGVLAKALAARRPELVSTVVTLGAPTVSMLRIHPLVLAQVGLLAALGSGRVPGLFSLRCLRGPCCAPFRAALEAPFPRDVRYVALYSRTDGIVDWRACLDPAADERVEVIASHLGMARSSNADRPNSATVQRSFRLSSRTLDLLGERAAETSESRNALAQRLLDEGLRIDRHPLIRFRTGGSGVRRPALVGTRLDIWQVIDTVRAEEGDPAAAAEYLGISEAPVRAAIDYYADFTEEVDAYRTDELAFVARERARSERGRRVLG